MKTQLRKKILTGFYEVEKMCVSVCVVYFLLQKSMIW